MTDVPFTVVANLSSWLLLRGCDAGDEPRSLGDWSSRSWRSSSVKSAFRYRSPSLSLISSKPGFGLSGLIEATTPVVLGFTVQTAYQGWLHWLDRVPATFGGQITNIRTRMSLPGPTIAGDAATIIFYALVYTGYPLFPFQIVADRRDLRSRGRILYLGPAGGAAVLMVVLKFRGTLMPLHENVLTKGGIGWDQAWRPSKFWLLVTLMGCFGAILPGRPAEPGGACVASSNPVRG